MKSKRDALLGQLAIEKGFITEAQLAECMKAQQQPNGSRALGEVLLSRKLIRKADLNGLLEEQTRRLKTMDSYQKMQKVEFLFGQLLVKDNKATQIQINKCLELQQQMAEKGVSPIPRLGELLVEHGFLDKKTVAETLKLQNKEILVCPACGKQYNVVSPEEGKSYRCKACQTELVRRPQVETLRADDTNFGFELPTEEQER